jgi:hypothetical protein
VELAREFQRPLDEGVVNNRVGLAERHGISQAWVTRLLKLLRLHPRALKLLADTGDAT